MMQRQRPSSIPLQPWRSGAGGVASAARLRQRLTSASSRRSVTSRMRSSASTADGPTCDPLFRMLVSSTHSCRTCERYVCDAAPAHEHSCAASRSVMTRARSVF